MHGRAKAVAIILVGLSLCVFALTAGLSWYVNSSRGRSLLMKKINAMVPGRLLVAHHRLSLFNGEIIFRDLKIQDRHGKDLAGVDRLSINLSLASLFKKSLVVETMDFKRPWLHLSRNENGRLNIVDVFAVNQARGETTVPDTAKPSFNVILKQFSLSEGYLCFKDAAGGKSLILDDVNATANGNLRDKSGILKIDIGKPRLVYKGHQSDFRRMDLALALSNGHIEPLVIKTENQFASLLLYGDIRRVFSDPELDLSLSIDFSIAEVESFFDLGRNDSGRVKAYLDIKGRLDNPKLNLKADYQDGRIAGHAVERMDLQFHLVDREATLARLSVDTAFGRLGLSGRADLRGVFPKSYFSPSVDWEKTACEGRLQTVALDLASIISNQENPGGKLDALLNFKSRGVTLETLAADADVEIVIEAFRSSHMVQPVRVQSRASGRMRDGTLWLDLAEIETADVHVSAGGSLDLDAERMDGRFRLETREVASLLSLFGLSRIHGALTLEGNLKGRPANPDITISATGEAVRIQDIDVGNIGLSAELDKTGQLKVDSLTIENKGSSLMAEGDIQLFAEPYRLHREMPLSARLALANMEYNDFFKGPDIRGSLGGSLALAGNLRSLQASADVYARGVEFKQVRLGAVAGKARFNNGTLFLDSMHLTRGHTDLKAEGEIGLLRKGTWQVVEDPAFRLTLSDGHLFMEDFSDTLEGELLLDADLGGSLNQPRGSLRLSGLNLDLGLQRIESVAVDLKIRDRQVIIEPVEIILPGGGELDGAGRIGYDRSMQFRLQTRDLPVESIDRVRAMEVLSGKLDLDITGSGLLHRPDITGKAEWKEIRFRNEKIDDVSVNFGLKENRVFLKGKQTFELDAGYDLLSKAFFVDLMLNDTRLEPWCAIARRPEFGGNIRGSLRAEGYAGDLERTRANVAIHKLEIELNGEHFAGTEDFHGTLKDGVFEIPEFYLELLDQGHFSLRGSGAISGPVDLEVVGDIPLRVANLFARDLPKLNGTLSIMTSVGGTFLKPELNGEIRIEEGGVFIPELQQELHRVNGRVALSSGGEVVGDLSGMLDNGRFDVQAVIDLEGFLPRQIEARVSAAALPLQIPDTMEMLFNTDLAVRGTPGDLVVEGDVVLLEGTYYKDFKLNLLQAIQTEKREESPRKTEFAYPYLKPLRFNIHFKHRQPFLVDNNIAYMEISPDVILRGTPETPIITGSAKVDNGVITYQNKEFVVQRGAVDFVNPYRTEAEIDIKGEVEIREWRITISLYGPPDRLIVDLSSSPPEEDADIISLLVFKKTTYELNTGSGGVGQSPTVLLAQLLASSFGDDIKDGTGIDILELEAESARDKDSTDRIKVTVGKDLSERMTVKYSVESKDGGYVQRASTEYKLFENFLVSGFQDTKGVYGGELIFRLEFRLFR